VHRRKEVQSRVAVMERGAHYSARQELLESVCGGPMSHLGVRGQESTGNRKNRNYG